MKFFNFIIFLLSFNASLCAQISFDYNDVLLEEALNDLENKYQFKFSYSKDFISIDQYISASAHEVDLQIACEKLFINTNVQFKIVGEQILLKQRKLFRLEQPALSVKLPDVARPSVPIKEEKITENVRIQKSVHEKRNPPKVNPIDSKKQVEIGSSGKQCIQLTDFSSIRYSDTIVKKEKIAQISLLPEMSSNFEENIYTVNNVSTNFFWGTNGGVNGIEVGGIGNIVINEVKGLQVSGIFNKVGGSVQGTQIAGLVNINERDTRGLQIAGLWNKIGSGNSLQIAGLFNHVQGEFTGFQIAGLFNVVGEKTNALQIAGLANFNNDHAKKQIAGLFNIAKDIEQTQVAGILNVAKNVQGTQVGLINYCESISGTPIGLINIIKNGYNVLELSTSAFMATKLSLKFGSEKFYNILEIGHGFRDQNWGLGYGFGRQFSIHNKLRMNAEILGMHIEYPNFSNHRFNINLQNRYTLDYPVSKRFNLFAGPNINALNVRKDNFDNIDLSKNGIFHITTKNENWNFWLGFNAGLRFSI